jgi:phosphatidylglycerol:prolipoprotein diacylglycerol transferase
MGLKNASTGEFTYHHPTFLYESVWNAIGFVILHFLSKRKKYDGQIALGYVAWYGLGRMFIEGLRTDSLYWGPYRVSQIVALSSCFLAVSILAWKHFAPNDPNKIYANRVAAQEAAKAEETETTDTEA